MKQRVLVVGFGFMGQTHAGNLLKNPRAELVGIVDPCAPAERLRTIRGNTAAVSITPEDIAGVPHYRNMDEALNCGVADAVIIALPTRLHHDAVIAALEHNQHVLVEKPFAIDPGECENMIRLARARKRVLAVGYVVRHMREYEVLRECVKTQRLGRLEYMSLSRYTGIPGWGDWQNPEVRRASGGALFDLLSHDVDFARSCLGEPLGIESVSAPYKRIGDDLLIGILRYPECRVLIQGGFMTPAAFPFKRGFTACFENGTLVSDVPGEIKEIAADGTIRVDDFSRTDPYYVEVERFLEALISGDVTGVCTGDDALGTIRCCHDISSGARA